MPKKSESDNACQIHPQAALEQMTQDPRIVQMISVATKLSIADLLKDGPKSSRELAELTEAHPQALYRLLRALASLGIFAETEGHHFELTPLAAHIQTIAPDSMPTFAPPKHSEWRWRPWDDLLYSVRTGKPAFDHVFGMSTFDYFAQNTAAAKSFNEMMTMATRNVSSVILDAYDFSEIDKLVDVGGSHGMLLAVILRANPRMRGVIFDLPSVTEGGRGLIEREGVADRCELVPGSFFDESVPAGDAYILSHVIHDWDDAHAITILKNCRHNIVTGGKLLVVETVVPSRNEPSSANVNTYAKIADLDMLLLEGGLERTEAEFRALFDLAGFRLTNIVPRQSWISVIEGVPTQ